MAFRTGTVVALAVLAGGCSAAPPPSAAPTSAGARSPVRTAAPMPDVAALDLAELRELLGQGRTTSAQLVRAYLRRIDAYENKYEGHPGINAVISVNRRAGAEARRLDAERRAGRVRGPLHGIPIVVKDNFDTGDMPTTTGSDALAKVRPPDDAEQVRRLRAAGAIVLAKTNLHEFAMNIYTISSRGGQTRNPYDQDRHPGGSSGGTGAGVAAAFAPAGLGTDTCGSIRIPAAHNNLVGLRPTMGLSSRDGIAPLAGTQDVAGPLATTVRDVATIMDVTAGYDPKDPVTKASRGKVPDSYLTSLRRDALRGKRVGVFTSYLATSTPGERATTGLVRDAVKDMRKLGADAVELGPHQEIIDIASRANRVRDEFERDLNRYLAESARGRPRSLAGLEPPRDEVTLADIAASGKVTPSVLETVRAWVGSPALPNPAYEEKLRQAEILRDRLTGLMREHRLDAIVYPSIKEPPTRIGTEQDYLNCRLAGYTGFPALSVPAGFTKTGLPVGVELLGRPFSEPDLLAMAYAYEQATHHRKPPKSTPPL